MWTAAKRLVAAQPSWRPGTIFSRHPDDRFFVYEAWNASLREMLVGIAEGDFDALVQIHREHAPSSIAHWRTDHKVHYKVIEEGIPQEDAALFARLYGEQCASDQIRVYLEA